ncbi:Mce-associated membrane protein [Kribbella antiqua]|uniref:Mce-associated membrane protein n=1 Tax=Kribbella antiqua TaxID=2512217 RepID=A0A4R2J020_9ACTN|nr:Mce-associated membrane protein [Kribbella antiqua]
MPDRSRNRPRIAGQRRTSLSPETETTPEEAPEAPEAASEAPETVAEDVTPATSEPSEAIQEPSFTTSLTTESDGTRSKVGAVLSAALGIALVLVLTVAVVLGIKAWQGKQAEDARDQAAAAGRKAAETALSYDYRDLDKSFAAARATMTPEFAKKFDDTAKVAGELATKTKATVKADVREVGVRDGDADRVTLIIFVNQTTTSTITQGKPRVDLNRTRFVMVRNGDQWLVQEIAGL